MLSHQKPRHSHHLKVCSHNIKIPYQRHINVDSSLLVGPGASKEGEYKNPEYYQYNPMSFYDIEKEMSPFRLTQPSNKQ